MTSHNPYGNYPSRAKAKREEAENAVPTGTIPEIMAWVGDDKDRAQQVLDAEKDSSEPRKTLVKRLEEVLGD